MVATALIIGIVCAGLFMLVGPVGVLLAGVVLCLAGISNKKDD